MNMEATLKTKEFIQFLNDMSIINLEGRVIVTDGIMQSTGVDGANVLLGVTSIKSDTIKGDERFCIDIARILSSLKTIKSTEIKLSVSDGKLIVAGGKSKLKFPLLADKFVRNVSIPKVEFTTEVEVFLDDLQEIFQGAATMADKVQFKLDNEILSVSAGDDVDGSIYFQFDNIMINKQPSEPAKATFSIDYIKDIRTNLKDADTVTIAFGSDMPIKMSLVTDTREVQYLLAPRIED